MLRLDADGKKGVAYMKLNRKPMTNSFIICGHKVSWKEGLAEFYKHGVLIRVPYDQFSYDWAVKMNYKLSILVGSHLIQPSDSSGLGSKEENE